MPIQIFNFDNQSTLSKQNSQLLLNLVILKKMEKKEINEDSNSLSILLTPLEKRVLDVKKPTFKQPIDYQQDIKGLKHSIVTAITVISPIALQSRFFVKELQSFRFQKKPKIVYQTQVYEQRQLVQFLSVMKDIFGRWLDNLSRKFFIVFNNGDLAYFFHKHNEEKIKKNSMKVATFAIMSCKKSIYSARLNQFSIPYENLPKTQLQTERLLLKNKSIQLFWTYFTNLSVQKPLSFQLISNFYFINSYEAFPVERYNGKQQRDKFQHLAVQKRNILGEKQAELHSIKIQGLWMQQNIEKMYNKIEQLVKSKNFAIEFQCHLASEDMYQQCEKL